MDTVQERKETVGKEHPLKGAKNTSHKNKHGVWLKSLESSIIFQRPEEMILK